MWLLSLHSDFDNVHVCIAVFGERGHFSIFIAQYGYIHMYKVSVLPLVVSLALSMLREVHDKVIIIIIIIIIIISTTAEACFFSLP